MENNPAVKIEGVKIDKLIKWNSFIPILPFSNQLLFLRSQELEVLYGGAARGGKALDLRTPILTTDGWKMMKDVHPGDFVFDETGKPTLVIDESEIMHNHKCYKVTFDDESEIVADEGHLWLTSTVASRQSKKRYKSRVKGKQIQYSRPQKRIEDKVVTTEQIKNTLRTVKQGNRLNHAIDNTLPLQFEKKNLLIKPYVLGLWLGDGTSRNGQITIGDADALEIMNNIYKCGYGIHELSSKYQYGIEGLHHNLKVLNLIQNKHIPDNYLFSDFDSRLELIQGLMDTDGTCNKKGQCEFDNTNEQIVLGLKFLLNSVGVKCTIREKEARCNGKSCGIVYRLKFTSSIPMFKLSRKAKLQKLELSGEQTRRFITSVEEVESRPVKCISVMSENHLYLAGTSLIPTHNSVSLLAAALQYVDIPNYHALIIRKSYTELTKADGLIPLSKQWLMGRKDCKWNDKLSQWEFENGSTLSFGYLANENDIYNYIGLAFQFIAFDELTQHTEQNYRFLFSRLVRTKEQEAAGIPLRMRATTNPNGQNSLWVYNRFINKVTKVAIRNEIIENLALQLGVDEEEVPDDMIKLQMPKFIPSKMIDNPYIDQRTYLSSLNKLDPVTRKQLLEGDWEIRPAGNMFRRDWFKKINPRILDSRDFTRMVRYWDLAGTTDEESDFTATCKMGYNRRDKCLYIFDVQKFKKVPGEIEVEFKRLQLADGMRTITVMEQEPGSAGVNNSDHYRREVSRKGYQFKIDKVSGNKLVRAQPVSGAAGNGLVKVVDYPKVMLWWEDAMSQLEAFPDSEHDDMVDAISGAYNWIMKLIRTDAAYIGQLKGDDLPIGDNNFSPAYMKPQTGDKIIDVMTGSTPEMIFRNDWRRSKRGN